MEETGQPPVASTNSIFEPYQQNHLLPYFWLQIFVVV